MSTIQKYEKFISRIEKYRDIAEPHLSDLKGLITKHIKARKELEIQDRDLKIAVVGQVKAGKSSFLNATLFDGDGILPKAATPMTAALTVIKYSEQVKAEIEFYSPQDWKDVLNAKDEYDRIYEETKIRLQKEMEENKETGLLGIQKNKKNVKITEKEIELNANFPEEVKASKELVDMAENSNLTQEIDNYLGKKQEIKDVKNIKDLMDKLEDYVGADGKFTPIVKNSIIYYDDPELKEIEIIDTPGINDPVISRGKKTKDFLAVCDVVFMLSRCGRFIDISDVQILGQNLPNNGVKDIVIIGSQQDAEMYGEHQKYKDIQTLLDNLEITLEDHVNDSFNRLKNRCTIDSEKKILGDLIDSLPPIFVSSMAFNISKHYDNLDDEEKHFLDLYNSMYDDFRFDKERLYELSNIELVKEKLIGQKEKKEKILKNRLEEKEIGFRRALQENTDKLKENIQKDIHRIKSEDVNSLKEKEKILLNKINSGKGQLEGSFENMIIKIRKDFSILKTEIKQLTKDYSRIEEYNETETETYEVSVSKWYNPFSWGKTKTKTRTINYRYANVHEAIENVESFLVDCERKIKDEIIDIIDINKFKGEIKNKTLGLFDLSDESFNVDDVIQPVERAVNKITVPEIDIEDKNYSDKLSSRFSSSRVTDSEVDALKKVQKEVVRDMLKNIQVTVDNEVNKVVSKLENTQNEFVSNLTKDFKEDLEKIKKGIENKQEMLDKYENLQEIINNEGY